MLREEISRLIYTNRYAPAEERLNRYELTDAIIALFRERLLSEASVLQAAKAYRKRTTGQVAGWAHEEWPISDALTAALDAITAERPAGGP